jgi:BlaI family penicillinase repressor
MARRPALSKAEMEVARIVWQHRGATVREVLEALPEDRTLDYKTVQTYLRRLQAKGYLRTRREGRSLRYLPRVRPGQVIKETVDDFVNRLFDGEPLPLFEHLIRDHGLTDAEIQRLRALLNELEGRQP